MSYTGKLKGDLYYCGIKLEINKSYRWSGISNNLYTCVKWECKMKIIDIDGDDIYIKSSDDGELTKWSIENLEKDNIKIK